MLGRAKIAVVNDREQCLNDIHALISQISDGFEVSQFKSAYPLLEELDQGENYDLIIVGLAMKEANGLALVAAIRNRGLKSPMIMVSGVVDDLFQENLIELDITGFLHRSAPPEELKETILKALKRGELVKPKRSVGANDEDASSSQTAPRRRVKSPCN